MKKYLFFLFCFGVLVTYHSQVLLNRSFHVSGLRSGKQIEKIHNAFFFGFEHGLIKMKSNGALQNLNLSVYGVHMFFKTDDQKLLVLGNNVNPCDDFINDTQFNFFSKVDTNGNAIFTNTIMVPYGHKYTGAAQLSDSGYVAFTNKRMHRFDTMGVFIDSVNLGFDSQNTCLALLNNQLLLSSVQGSAGVLSIISGTNAVQTTTFLTTPFLKFQYLNGQSLIGLNSNGILYKFSASLNNTGQSTVNSIRDFYVDNDSIYFITDGVYFRADTLFNVISSTTVTTAQALQKAIFAEGSEVAILSDFKANITQYLPMLNDYSNSFIVMNKSATHNYSYDLAITQIVTDTLYCNVQFNYWPTQTNSIIYYRAKLMVKNMGTQTVNRFKLSTFYDRSSFGCYYTYSQQQFSGLNLQPGDSVVVTSNTTIRRVNATTASGGFAVSNFCYYVSVPNDETDKTYFDNEICQTVSILPNSINEELLLGMSLTVFPNPFKGTFTIKSEFEMNEIKLFNALGVLSKA